MKKGLFILLILLIGCVDQTCETNNDCILSCDEGCVNSDYFDFKSLEECNRNTVCLCVDGMCQNKTLLSIYDEGKCDSIAKRDYCYLDAAMKKHDKTICENINDDSVKSLCLG
jgi:hypothetical protein